MTKVYAEHCFAPQRHEVHKGEKIYFKYLSLCSLCALWYTMTAPAEGCLFMTTAALGKAF
jgi:hypothetical protein